MPYVPQGGQTDCESANRNQTGAYIQRQKTTGQWGQEKRSPDLECFADATCVKEEKSRAAVKHIDIFA